MIYLDHAATTPMDPQVIEVVRQSMEAEFANSGTVYRLGLDAKMKIDRAIEEIREILGIPGTHRIIFTSGGSESNNLFIKGLCFPDKKTACLGLEHPSIASALGYLKAFSNDPVCLRSFQKEGRMDLQAVPVLNDQRVRLLCLSHVNNETGAVNDPLILLEALEKQSPQTRLYLDGVQGVGKLALSPGMWSRLAGYALSAHKINGPKGIGILIFDSRLSLTPQIHGGKQQYGIRSGTLPTPLILGLTEALRLSVARQKTTLEHFGELRRHLVEKLKYLSHREANLKLRFNSHLSDDARLQSPAIVNFSFPPVEGEVLLHHLEERGIYVGLGSACSAYSKEPSKILTGIGLSEEEARCSLRISFGGENTLEDIDRFVSEFFIAFQSLYPSFFQNSSER
ncbi:MAG: cysteine desulfurase family protein [Nitrospinota bacterium]|nr:cysteine desulfurase family protein [Nitrospinota bacterium]